jgi:hypothetical protein
MAMTREELAEIRERVDKAVQGPWRYEVENDEIWSKICCITSNEFDSGINGLNNIEFIAHSRQDVPALLTEIERLQKIEAKAKEVVKVMAPWYCQKGKQMPEPMVVVETLSNLARVI